MRRRLGDPFDQVACTNQRKKESNFLAKNNVFCILLFIFYFYFLKNQSEPTPSPDFNDQGS